MANYLPMPPTYFDPQLGDLVEATTGPYSLVGRVVGFELTEESDIAIVECDEGETWRVNQDIDDIDIIERGIVVS